jgi:photosystem II stability/assembly factor-like uncharacterized protein
MRPAPISICNLSKSLTLLNAICIYMVLLAPLLHGSPATEPSERMPLSPKSLLLDVTTFEDEIIVVGERGHILKSRDNGSTWRQISTPTRSTLTNVHFLDNRSGWASGHSGIILSTRDGGDSWTIVSGPDPEISYFDAWFFDNQTGLFIGGYGEYAKTIDAGVSLEKEWISEEELHFYGVDSGADGTLYVVGEAGQLLRSDNQGLNWQTIDIPYSGSLFGVMTLEGKTLMTYGLRGHILRSEDQGESWETIDSKTTAMLTDAVVLSSGTIIVSTITDTLLMSSDHGQTFFPVKQEGIDGTVALAESPDAHFILLCGRHGVLPVTIESLENALRTAKSSHE